MKYFWSNTESGFRIKTCKDSSNNISVREEDSLRALVPLKIWRIHTKTTPLIPKIQIWIEITKFQQSPTENKGIITNHKEAS